MGLSSTSVKVKLGGVVIERLIHDPKRLTVREGVILFGFQYNGEPHSNRAAADGIVYFCAQETKGDPCLTLLFQ